MRKGCPASRYFRRGRSLEIESPPGIDFQMHTLWTDGRSPVREMIAAADAIGLEAIAITEHVNAESGWYPEFVAEVKAERAQSRHTTVYFGVEIAAADYRGGLKTNPARLDAELILGVVHRLPKQDGNGFWRFNELRPEDGIELEIRALKQLAANRQIDVIGHPGGTSFKKFGAFPVEWMEPVFSTAREHGIAIELNSSYLWDLEGMLALLRRVDPLVSFGSDAHEACDVGSNLAKLRQLCGTAATAVTL